MNRKTAAICVPPVWAKGRTARGAARSEGSSGRPEPPLPAARPRTSWRPVASRVRKAAALPWPGPQQEEQEEEEERRRRMRRAGPGKPRWWCIDASCVWERMRGWSARASPVC
ncbi:unnamed protein product [Prorocentrum cordatum]|uniref:Uncharacterized protein n=1 Tax=Prorocentrum cordatum TaxID=2364126 RepID=A0ABN9V458_9DINO|nr:unnamed protein product [Polarella glacialis]